MGPTQAQIDAQIELERAVAEAINDYERKIISSMVVGFQVQRYERDGLEIGALTIGVAPRLEPPGPLIYPNLTPRKR